MITSLYIDNLKGVSSPISYDMIASNKIKRNSNNYYSISQNKKILKAIGTIGANGCGKTSIISAIESIITFITFPFRKNINRAENFNEITENLTKDGLKEFLMSISRLDLPEQNINKIESPTTIKLECYIPARENAISGIYEYTLKYNSRYRLIGVLNETLRYKDNFEDNYLTLFSTNNNIESEIGTTIIYENNDNIQLSELALKNINYYKTFINELTNHTIIMKEGMLNHKLEDLYNASKNNFIKLCNIADSKITNVILSSDDTGREFLNFEINKQNYLKFYQLSSGTKKIIHFGCEFLNAIYTNSQIIVDELETHLHSSLSLFLLKLVNNSNPKYATQLFFTTHSFDLALNLDNDQLYYIRNTNESYNCESIAKAITKGLISKDKNPFNAIEEGILISNPDSKKIDNFINTLEHVELQ